MNSKPTEAIRFLNVKSSSRRGNLVVALVCLVIVLVVAGFAGLGGDSDRTVWGQFQAFQSIEAMSAELLSPPRSVRQQIREADEAIDQKRFSDAVVRLGDLLRRGSKDDMPETAQDYFTAPDRAGLSRTDMIEPVDQDDDSLAGGETVMRLVRDRIGGLPKAGRELYELRYGPLAAKTLDDAKSNQDWDAIGRVRREFFHTDAGYRASYLLAMREWYLGHPLATALLLDDVVGSINAVNQLGDDVVWLHAAATLNADRPITIPVRLPKAFVGGVDVKEATAKELAAKWEAAVRERFASDPVRVDPLVQNYAIMGANGNRNGLSEGQLPLSNPRWMLETSGSPRQERMIESETESLKATGLLPPPSWMPLRVGDQVLMRTTERLVGVDHRTGKRVWQYPWFSPPDSITDADDEDSGGLQGEDDPKDILAQRVWNDVPYGQLSSDGQRVFMIDNLDLVQSERINPFGMRAIRSMEASKNTLVALDLSTQGKLLWRLGADESEPSSLSDAFFLGPPLPVRGHLYAMIELAGEILLVCLNPADGAEQWRQILVSVESSGITTDPLRRVAGAMPTYHEGLLICPTGTGVTIAVDLIDRTLRWVIRHPRNEDAVRHALRPPSEISMTQLSQRWASPVAIAAGNYVALTPVESDRLIVVDAVTGEEQFRPQPRIKNLYLAGLRDGRYVVVRADRVMGYDIETGSEVWSTPTELMRSGQQVSGRGVFGPSSYFLPTTTDELIEISTSDGHVLSRRDVRFPLGNLIAIDGEIISQATTTLAVSYGQQSLTPQVNAMLAENPDDFFATVRKAELLLELGERDSAMSLLSKAREIEPDNDEVILLSVEAMLGTLRNQKILSSDDVATLKNLIDRPEQKAELLVLQITRLIESNQRSEAFDLLLELSRLISERPLIAKQQNQILPTPGRSFSLSSWLTARVAELRSGGDQATRGKLQQQLEQHLTMLANSNRRIDDLFLEHFMPMLDSTDSEAIISARRGSIDQAVGREDYLTSERMIWGTTFPTDAAVTRLPTNDLLDLARTYSAVQWNEDRRRIGEILQSRDLTEDVESQVAEIPFLGLPRGQTRWPAIDGPGKIEMEWQSTRMHPIHRLASDRSYAKTIHLMGQTTLGWQAISNSNPLALLDQDGIARSIVVEDLTVRNSSDKEITISGGLMLVLTPSELIAIDLFRVLGDGQDEIVRWRQSLGPDGQPVAKLRSETSKFGDEIYRYLTNSRTANADEAQLRLGPVLGDRLFLLQGNDLICLHSVTGQTLWRTDIGAPGSGVVAKDGRVAVISERTDRVIHFDWYDGRMIESKPLLVGSLMTTIGTNVLMVSKTETSEADDLHDPYLVEIFDPITMKRLQSRVASPVNLTDQTRTSGYGELIEGRYFLLLDNAGRATIWDVLEGKQLADVNVELRNRLFGVSMLNLQDRFLVFPNCKLDETTLRAASNTTIAGGSSVRGATGVHCIQSDGASGDYTLAWSTLFDSPRGVTTHQPYATPMLLLVRGKLFNSNTASRRRELDVWGLNLQNGETVFELIGKQIGMSNPRIETNVRLVAHRNQMIAEIQNETMTFTFTNPVGESEGEGNETATPTEDEAAVDTDARPDQP